jgi:hypothetical protein
MWFHNSVHSLKNCSIGDIKFLLFLASPVCLGYSRIGVVFMSSVGDGFSD